MGHGQVLVVGSGHLAHRITKLLAARNQSTTHLTADAFGSPESSDLTFDAIAHGLRDIDLGEFSPVDNGVRSATSPPRSSWRECGGDA